MSNYLRYFTFEPSPEFTAAAGADADDLKLPSRLQSDVRKAIQEIAQTREGRDLIEHAIETEGVDKIQILQNKGGISMAVSGGIIAIGTVDGGLKYLNDATGRYHDVSLQNLIVHELFHKALGHDARDQQENIHNEAEAIEATNRYMKKYYGEPERTTDPGLDSIRLDGTRRWELNQNFKLSRESFLQDIQGIDETKLAEMSPEIQSLHALRKFPEHFNAQYDELNAGGGLEIAQSEMATIKQNRPDGTAVAEATPPAPNFGGTKLATSGHTSNLTI